MRSHVLFAATAIVLLASSVEAASLCQHCGCHRNCKKVCRLICEKKKEKKTEYDVECEDFCIPGPSKRCGIKTECDGDGHRHCEFVWQPRCATVHTRKKLVKNEVTKEVPVYKWKVEEYCCVCGHLIKVEEKDKKAAAPDDKIKAERLPPPPAGRAEHNPQNKESLAAYESYYSGAESPDSDQPTAVSSPADDAAEGQATFDIPANAKGEPRRLFPRLLDR
ncbi:MAG TPA: hypothetical protein VHC22_18600 [Pirellulales bacterium]|nr:hypothetical protein [Pirellulales bacterium]